jgi:hypothetical protein
MPRPRHPSQFALVKSLLEAGFTYRQIEEETGVPYQTIRGWRKRTSPPGRNGTPQLPPPAADWRPPDGTEYCYLLGLYLGDGCLFEPKRGSPRLVLTLDARYPQIIEAADAAIRATFPDVRSVCRNQVPGAVAVCASHPGWLVAFPQHGAGRKHARRIELANWQRRLAAENPQYLLRGLIHSDGSRCANSFSVPLPSGRTGHYSYTRYFFTNYSADIRRIFCDHCDLLGIRWTQSSFKNISIADRKSVAILDSFVGPKR